MGIQSGTITAIEACSPAKLNLFLHVTGRRPDGYHSLQTVFQLLNWGDDMRFEVRTKPGVTLSGDTDDIAPEQNLILRAAQALGQTDRGAHNREPSTIERQAYTSSHSLSQSLPSESGGATSQL